METIKLGSRGESVKTLQTLLKSAGYNLQVDNCTGLVNAPELPATTLANSCYSSMFSNCSSLQVSPKIYATHYYSSRYLQNMFLDCTNLKTIYCNARYTNSAGTTEIATTIGTSWLSGVPNTADCIFYKNPEWAGPTSRGVNSIPANWQIVDWVE